MDYASRPLSDFNKYEVLDMVESLQHTAQDTKHEQQNFFYHLAYQTVRCKLDVPSDQFRSLVLRLLGEKDHEKIFDCVSKVEKHYRPRSCDGATAISPYYRGNWGRNSYDFPRNAEQALSCFIVLRKAISIDGVISGKEISPGRRRMERLSQPRSNEWPFFCHSQRTFWHNFHIYAV